MALDIDRMRQIAQDLYIVAVQQAFGQEGTHALRELIDTLVKIYQRVDPGGRHVPLIVFVRVASRRTALMPSSTSHRVAGPALITSELDGACSVEVLGNGDLLVQSLSAVDPEVLSTQGIVYSFSQNGETFHVNGVAYSIINPSGVNASIFARPTFSSLRAALEGYKVRVARETSCLILQEIWADDRRLFLKAKPEATMRKSLNQFLSNVLQNAEVRPEQNVDETHPVDIKVTWSLSDQRAIIEIKWLGDSQTDDGKIATSYREARAKAGAEQLAEYLESSAAWGPTVRTRGYLAVFDARRKGLTVGNTRINERDGFFYRDKEIEYDPDFSALRSDFEQPVRLFLNPVC